MSVPQAKRPDPRLVFLGRAAALLRLFDSCDLTLDEAIDGLLDAVEQLHGLLEEIDQLRQEREAAA
jgi:hypothetical protein